MKRRKFITLLGGEGKIRHGRKRSNTSPYRPMSICLTILSNLLSSTLIDCTNQLDLSSLRRQIGRIMCGQDNQSS